MEAEKRSFDEVSEEQRLAAVKPGRNNINLLRLLAAFGVINIHVPLLQTAQGR